MKKVLIAFLILISIQALSQIHYRGIFDEHVRDTNNSIFVIDSAHYLPGGLGNSDTTVSKRFIVTEKNESGKMIRADRYDFDEDSQTWEHRNKYFTSYFENGSLNEYTKLIYFPDSLDWILDEYQRNSENNQLLTYITYFRYPIPIANFGRRDTYEYNDFDSIIMQKTEHWNLFSPWYDYERIEYQYNDDQQRTKKVSYERADTGNLLVPDFKHEYYYEDGLKMYTLVYKYITPDSVWDLRYRFAYTHDDSGNNVQTTYSRVKDDSSWYHYYRRTYIYNDLNRKIEQQEASYDTLLQHWISTYHSFWEYMDDTILKVRYYKRFKKDTGIWVNSHRVSYSYDNNFNVIKILDESGDWTGWINSKQNKFIYTNENVLDEWSVYGFVNWPDTTFWVRGFTEDYFVGLFVDVDETPAKDRPKLRIFPNPAISKFYLRSAMLGAKDCSVELINLLGRRIKHINVPIGQSMIEIDVGGLPKGIYLVRLICNNELIGVEKLAVY